MQSSRPLEGTFDPDYCRVHSFAEAAPYAALCDEDWDDISVNLALEFLAESEASRYAPPVALYEQGWGVGAVWPDRTLTVATLQYCEGLLLGKTYWATSALGYMAGEHRVTEALLHLNKAIKKDSEHG